MGRKASPLTPLDVEASTHFTRNSRYWVGKRHRFTCSRSKAGRQTSPFIEPEPPGRKMSSMTGSTPRHPGRNTSPFRRSAAAFISPPLKAGKSGSGNVTFRTRKQPGKRHLSTVASWKAGRNSSPFDLKPRSGRITSPFDPEPHSGSDNVTFMRWQNKKTIKNLGLGVILPCCDESRPCASRVRW